MDDIWLRGYKRVNLGLSGASYLDRRNPKLLWHTTEGSSVAGARDAFRAYPPHLCYHPITREREQYIPLNRAAYACKANDREYLIQVEVVGFAGTTHNWSPVVLQRLAEDVVQPIAEAVGVPPVVVHHGFRGAGEGIILASPSSPIRLSAGQLRSFSGHLGHQHMPAPDAHWDPGRLPIRKILDYAGDDMPLSAEDLNKIEAIVDRKMRVGVRYIDNGDPDKAYEGHTTKKIREELAELRARVEQYLSQPADPDTEQIRAIVREEIRAGVAGQIYLTPTRTDLAGTTSTAGYPSTRKDPA